MNFVEFAELVHGKPLEWWQRELFEKLARGDRLALIERPRLSMSTTLEMGRAMCAAFKVEQQ